MSIEIEHGVTPAGQPAPLATERDVGRAAWRGWRQKCPNCGQGRLYAKFLKITAECDSCGEALHHQRADDAPPYFTMLIVGHVAIGGVLAVEQSWAPEPWVQGAIWAPFIVLSSLWLLPRIKGVLVAYQWALRMHGFGGAADVAERLPTADPRTTPRYGAP